ncbi:MAG TPA: hypothetical protein VK907_07385, partial [Phnomibacter sp.]|nr:hypothetical protein [Phnomibacter sp.]
MLISSLMMARQPAIHLSFHLAMAVYAKLHFEFNGHQAVHPLHRSMAAGTFQIGPADVRQVLKFDMVRHIKNFHPFHGLPGVIVSSFILNFRVQGNDIFMAVEAFLNGGNTGVLAALDIRMAEAAVDRFDPGVNPMAEGDRLPRTDPLMRIGIINIDQATHQDKNNQQPAEPSNGRLRFQQFRGRLYSGARFYLSHFLGHLSALHKWFRNGAWTWNHPKSDPRKQKPHDSGNPIGFDHLAPTTVNRAPDELLSAD